MMSSLGCRTFAPPCNHYVSATDSSQAIDPIMDSVYSIFEDLSVPHEAEIGPGPAPGIKMPVRVLTSIKQEILDDADYSGTGVVVGRHKSEEVEEAIEEDVTETVEMPHLTAIVDTQQHRTVLTRWWRKGRS
ncbi:hypothetical protein B9Z55_028107 [Caenorhabditis nigoni]|uniref:Uncharacterized protein n=3 Tax=Caenorhabditis nigoni TaxID=1611254 RepID=A0A2G5SCS3_9PELO|nr:hypothetical protein B9Z55_028107 [Caenorhabditis nigoni]